MKLVFIGGGTGLSCLARHAAEILKENPSEFSELTVIQHPYDDGGHSGLIVQEYRAFGPGDFRKSIMALSSPWMNSGTYEALNRRDWHPDKTGGKRTMLLEEPSLGNLIMLSGMLKYSAANPGEGLLNGIRIFSDVCRLPKMFRVVPVSLDRAILSAHLADETTVVGQGNIARHHDFETQKIVKLSLVPPEGMPSPKLYEGAREAILEADKVVFSPGSWWTSIWPNTLPEGFQKAMLKTTAKIIMVVNLITQRSESSQWDSGEFVNKLFGAVGRPFHAIIYNDWAAQVALWKRRVDGRRLKASDDSIMTKLMEKYWQQEFFDVRFPPDLLGDFTRPGERKRSDLLIGGCFASWDGKSFSHNKHTVRRILDL